jgi:hypothetical protein
MARNRKVPMTPALDASVPTTDPKNFDKATLAALAILLSRAESQFHSSDGPSRFSFVPKPNRRYSKDRPTRASHINQNHYMKRDKNGHFGGWKDLAHPCAETGHDYRFERNDNYGRCKCCGDELLV